MAVLMKYKSVESAGLSTYFDLLCHQNKVEAAEASTLA